VDIAALIAAHDEAESIAYTVRAVLAVDGVRRVVVVDDASRDDTALLAEKAGAWIVRMGAVAGKGGALEAGAKRVADADIVLLLDADLGRAAEQAGLLLAPLLAGEAEMTIAVPSSPGPGAGGGRAARLARWGIARYGGGFEATYPLSGQRALTRDCLETVRPFMAGYGVEVGLSIRALRAGFRLREVAADMARTPDRDGRSGWVHRGRHLVHVAVALARLAREPVPQRPSPDDWR
jgi:glycosyltransferase involved in cell wall biosynthesis